MTHSVIFLVAIVPLVFVLDQVSRRPFRLDFTGAIPVRERVFWAVVQAGVDASAARTTVSWVDRRCFPDSRATGDQRIDQRRLT